MRLWALLGLFALAVQIALSFGHVDLGEIAATGQAPVIAADTGHALPAGPGNKPGGTIDHFCPICALLQLAASALPSLAPALPLPTRLAPAEITAPRLLALASSPALSFQARAPPSC
jgi:hypothetical protein